MAPIGGGTLIMCGHPRWWQAHVRYPQSLRVDARRRDPEMQAALTGSVGELLRSPRLTHLGGGPEELRKMIEAIENVWLDYGSLGVLSDLHRAASPKATIVFQPGSGAHARFYFLLGGLLVARGCYVLAIDRPDHWLSGGARRPPRIDGGSWCLPVAGLVERPLSLTLAEVRGRPGVSQVVTLQAVEERGPGPMAQPAFTSFVVTV